MKNLVWQILQYVVKFLSEPFMLQYEKSFDKKFKNEGELIV